MKQLKLFLGTFAMAMIVVFAQNARAGEHSEDDKWFKANFTEVRYIETESATFERQTIKVYRSNRSGNCYVMQGNGNRGGFSQVPCEDFVTDMDMLREVERIEALIAEQTEDILKRKVELDAAIEKYNEAFR